MAASNQNTLYGIDINGILPIILIGGGYLMYRFYSGAFEKLGLKQSEAGRTIAETASATNSAFNPNFYVQMKQRAKPRPMLIPTYATALNWAKMLKTAMNYWGTDENKIYAVFTACKSQAHVSYLAEVYVNAYKTSLFNDLKDELREAELLQIINQVKQLPQYIRA